MPENSNQTLNVISPLIEQNHHIAIALSDQLSANKIAHMAASCKLFYSAFSQQMIWKKKCQEDFLLTENHLKAISHLTQPLDSFKKLYGALSLLKQKEFNLSAFTKYTYKRPDRLAILFACCTDQVDEAMQRMPHEERFAWLEIAISIGNPILSEKTWVKSRISQAQLLALILKLGNYQILKRLASKDLMANPRALANIAIDDKNLHLAKQIVVKNPDINTLTIAIKTKTLSALSKTVSCHQTNSDHLLTAIEANDLWLTKRILEGNKLLAHTSSDIMESLYFFHAANNLNEEMNQYLIEKFAHDNSMVRIREHNFNKARIAYAAKIGDINTFKSLETKTLIDEDILKEVFVCGHLELVKHCLSTYPNQIKKISLLPECSKKGNLKMVRYILQNAHLFSPTNLHLPDITLTLAAQSGNDALVKFLTTGEHRFDLQQSDPSYFKAAIQSGNLDAIFYLLEIGLPQPTIQDFIEPRNTWSESELKFLGQFHRCFYKFEEAIFELRRSSKSANPGMVPPTEYLEESYKEFSPFYFQLLKKYLHSQTFILSETRYLPKITHEFTETDWLIILSSTKQFAQKYPHIDLGVPEWQSLFSLAKEKFLQLGYFELVNLTDEILVELNQSLKNQNDKTDLYSFRKQ